MAKVRMTAFGLSEVAPYAAVDPFNFSKFFSNAPIATILDSLRRFTEPAGFFGLV